MPSKKAPDLKKFTDIRKYNNATKKYMEDRDKDFNDFLSSLYGTKSTEKLSTEKRHNDDYKRLKGNIQKSHSDLRVNPKTGKREITTRMTIHKGLTVKEKSWSKKVNS